MKNIEKLTAELNNSFYKLRDGKIDRHDLAVMASTAAQIFSSIKVELEYSRLRKEPPKIAYLMDLDVEATA